MSSPARRAELKRQFAQECEAREAEECRVANLNLYDRIEEVQSIDDLKAVLLLICERAGIDPYEA